MIVVRQLGNGGAFDYDQPNTAFTLYDDQILVDCGYSIFPELMKKNIASKIKYVFVTHIHDDHIGSLGTFLYWKEFVDRKKVKVFLPSEVYDVLLHDDWFGAGKMDYPKGRAEFEFLEFERVTPHKKLDISVWVTSLTQQSHGNHYNTSYRFDFPVEESKFVRIAISGDTKANKRFEKFVFTELSIYHAALLIFHDFSYWNHPNNIHATEYDFNLIYSDRFKKHTVKVHTGDTDFKEVYTVDDLLENFSLK